MSFKQVSVAELIKALSAIPDKSRLVEVEIDSGGSPILDDWKNGDHMLLGGDVTEMDLTGDQHLVVLK